MKNTKFWENSNELELLRCNFAEDLHALANGSKTQIGYMMLQNFSINQSICKGSFVSFMYKYNGKFVGFPENLHLPRLRHGDNYCKMRYQRLL